MRRNPVSFLFLYYNADMKFLIISPGKGHDSTAQDGIAEYSKRIKF